MTKLKNKVFLPLTILMSLVTFSANINKISSSATLNLDSPSENKIDSKQLQKQFKDFPDGFKCNYYAPYINKSGKTSWIFVGISVNHDFDLVVLNDNQPVIKLLVKPPNKPDEPAHEIKCFFPDNSPLRDHPTIILDGDNRDFQVKSNSTDMFLPTENLCDYAKDGFIPANSLYAQFGFEDFSQPERRSQINLIYISRQDRNAYIQYEFNFDRKVQKLNQSSDNLIFTTLAKDNASTNRTVFLGARKKNENGECTFFKYEPSSRDDANLEPIPFNDSGANFDINIQDIIAVWKNAYILSDAGIYYYDSAINSTKLICDSLIKDHPHINFSNFALSKDGKVMYMESNSNTHNDQGIFKINLDADTYTQYQTNDFNLKDVYKMSVNSNNQLNVAYYIENPDNLSLINYKENVNLENFIPDNGGHDTHGSSSNAGLIAGVVIGSLGAVGIVVAGTYFYIKRKK